MKIGYVRVSTVEQNLARQEEWLENSIKPDKIFKDKASGKNTDRPQFKEMMDFVRDGDIIYIESFSRLSRSTKDLLETVQALKEKGVSLVSQKENVDTSTPQGKFVLTIFAALAEFERELMLERQREGIEIAKREGKYKGRKPLPDTSTFFTMARMWQEGKVPLREAIKSSNMSQATFFRKCKKHGIRKVKEVA